MNRLEINRRSPPQVVTHSDITSPESLVGKVPPQSILIEESVLGALMLEKDALTAVIEILKPADFYKESHQTIYGSIVELFNSAQPIDLHTVIHQLRKSGKLDFVGGVPSLTALTTRTVSSSHIEYHAQVISQYAIKRSLISLATQLQQRAYEDTQDVFTLLDQTEQSLFAVTDTQVRKNYLPVNALVKSSFQELEIKRKRKDGLTGIPSGFTSLDRITSGWQKSDLIIIAARPGMGKTAFLLTSLRNASVDHGYPVALFSLEMTSHQLTNRLLSSESELSGDQIKKGHLANHEWEQLLHTTSPLSNAPLYLDDTPALTIFELRAKCRRLKSRHGIQLIAIDYLQLMSGSSQKGSVTREQEIASISRSLKSIAKELDICILVCSQLSRAVETRGGNKRPQLSDLRESGSIEQDADLVLFLYRPEYYGLNESESCHPTPGQAEVIVAKHRNGSLDSAQLRFLSPYTKFTDPDFPDRSPPSPTFNTIIQVSKANGRPNSKK